LRKATKFNFKIISETVCWVNTEVNQWPYVNFTLLWIDMTENWYCLTSFNDGIYAEFKKKKSLTAGFGTST
jgi:hypothetical protein